ncbi:DUF2357 domain-containing protein [Fictibacillus terranigra]|uniref:DUF2357 domain-containing protein n=1 Tax=Fictibacillus terranigra TaxID=3058424 RepID=A0ABT8EAG6_9BACL|nr:DUF2357 domain-containing protein [Fictibacillus sp. CENA-BCM004]MDN4074927.1 DUF2357 domain-containing protein [Fictibacillus sp. CENA-BCM004]
MISLSKVNYEFSKNIISKRSTFSLFPKNLETIGPEVIISRITANMKLYLNITSSPSVPNLIVRKDRSDLFRDLCLREQTEYDFILSVPISKSSIKQQQILTKNPIYPITNLKLQNYITLNNSDTWYETEGFTFLSGRINYKNFIGISSIYLDNVLSADIFEFEVVSNKLSYESDFKELLNDLANIHIELILSLDNPTEIILDSDSLLKDTSFQVINLQLRKLLSENNLPLAIQTILSNPHSRLSYESQIEELNFPGVIDLTEFGINALKLKWKKKDSYTEKFRGFRPLEYFKEEIEHSVNTKENQYIKFSLEELEKLIQNLLFNIPQKYFNSKIFLTNSLTLIQEYLQEPIFKQIGKFTNIHNSMVFQKRSGYKEFIQAMQSFELGIQLKSNIFEFDNINGDLRPVSELYEYWCFFQIYYSLKTICTCSTLSASRFVVKTEKGYKLNLEKNKQSNVLFNYKDIEVELFYNRNFKQEKSELWEGTYDNSLYHPDISLRIKNQVQSHWIHFDSKFKLDKNKLEKMIKGESIQEGSYSKNDIHTAHAYRDAILGTRGVYILYPDTFNEASLFVRQPDKNYSNNFSLPSIGAFPLKPGESFVEQKEKLTIFLKNTLDILSQNYIYREELGFCMRNY